MRPFCSKPLLSTRGGMLAMGSFVAICGVMGCADDQIREVRVPRERSGLDAPQFQAGNRPGGAMGTGMGAMDSSATLERLLIAMIDRPNATYFLRIQSPTVDAIDAIRPQFDQIVQSLTFDNGRIQWKLPEGWTESEGGAMFRIATLKAPSGIEIFVTELSAGQEVLSNVNRWQGQLGLPPATEAALPIETIQVGEQKVVLYDARRTSTPNNSAASNGAASNGAPVDASTNEKSASVPPANAGATVAVPFTFPPLSPAWSSMPPSMVAVVRWEKNDAAGNLKLEVFKFPADAAFMEMVSIWGERLGAAPPSKDTFAAAVRATTVAGQPAELVSWPAVAENEVASAAKGSQIVRIAQGEHAWYIKLEGDRAALDSFSSEFQEFLANTKMAE